MTSTTLSDRSATRLGRHARTAAQGCWLVFCLLGCGAQARADASGRSSKAVGPGAIINALSDRGEALQFRIDSVDTDVRDRDGDVRLYGVSVRDPVAGTWEPYCAPDIEGRAAAIPVQGSWNARGELQPGTGTLTFACTSGAIAKCIRFGYKPWKTHRGVSLQPYHAACVRMVRADYCGDGRPHTKEGTQIDIWDGLGIQQRAAPDGHPEVFEAAWSPAGAAYLNMPRWSDNVADVVRECPAHVAGRTSADQPLTPAQVAQRHPEALIFDARFVRSDDRRPPRPATTAERDKPGQPR